MRSPNGFVRCWMRSATHMARAFRSAKCRPARRLCKLWWPRFTVPTWTGQTQVAAADQVDLPTALRALWIPTGTSKTRSPGWSMRVDEVKAAQHGIAVSDVAHALALATSGTEVGLIHDQTAREPVPAIVEIDRADRSSEQGSGEYPPARRRRQHGLAARVGHHRAQDHRAQHLSQESAPRGVCHRRRGRRRREPGLRHPEDEQGARPSHASGRIHA